MPIYIGNQKLGSLYLGSTKIKEAWVGDVKVYGSGDPYNPLNLPPFTIRVKLESGASMPSWCGESRTLVDPVENVWDVTKNDTSWASLFYHEEYDVGESVQIESVLGANSTGVGYMGGMFDYCSSLTSVAIFDTRSCRNMSYMFHQCRSLTTVPLFDTSSCTNMTQMFGSCRSLTTVPLFDTSSCTSLQVMFGGCRSLTSVPLFDTRSCWDMAAMFHNCTSLTSIPLFDTRSCTEINDTFWNCVNVQSGALALYQQASTQATIPDHGEYTFYNCGINTPTGLAELQQIPSSWGGLAPG